MPNSYLVSIIIPTFNRAHLIGETLDSIINQTYTNWECIVVDDRSTDNTENVLKDFTNKDQRIKYYKRPKDMPKGGNACRNFGIEKSNGNYVNFFDSDDLMIPNKIEKKVQTIIKLNVDYVISKTIDFNHPNSDKTFVSNIANYNFKKYSISHFNYISQNLNWLTPDALINSKLAKQVRFNENLYRGQEYNFFSKMTLLSEKGYFLDEFLTKRRLHKESIKNQFNEQQINKQAIILRMVTLMEIFDGTSVEVKKWYFANIAKNISRINMVLSLKEEAFLVKGMFEHFGFKCLFYFTVSRIFKMILGRNEALRRRLKKCLA